MSEVTFNIKVTMEERWVNHFVTFLKHMERLGNVGSSRYLAFYADGDGDYQPKFETDILWKQVEPAAQDTMLKIQSAYDAG